MSRSRHHTGWAGALAVAAELSRRSYDTTLTLGNTPSFDLLCSSPKENPMKVQVKSLSSKTFILIQNKLLRVEKGSDDFFFVIVFIPPENEKPLEFFVLSHQEIIDIWKDMPTTRKDGQPYKPGMDGVNWGRITEHRNRWDKLPV